MNSTPKRKKISVSVAKLFAEIEGAKIDKCVDYFQKQIHLYRAYCFMDWCMAEKSNSETHKPDRPASLFEGLLGRIYLADELLNIKDAKFPAYTV